MPKGIYKRTPIHLNLLKNARAKIITGKKDSRITVKCIKCGKEFKIHKCQINLTKFCSRKCICIDIIEKPCLECGKIFKTKKKNQEFCSRTCSHGDVVKKRISIGNTGKVRTEEVKKQISLTLKGKTFEELHGKEKAIEIGLKISKRLKGTKRSAESSIKIWETRRKNGNKITEEHRKNLSESHKGIKRSKESIIKGHKTLLENNKKRGWANPNKFESRVLLFINNLNLGEFVYSGDGSFLIGTRKPDFICENNKIVVLANGTYWHLGKDKLDITDENKKKVELLECKDYLADGWTVLFIWEKDEEMISNMRIYFPNVWKDCNLEYTYSTTLDKFRIA